MSPCLKKSGIPHVSYPRVSGDEPMTRPLNCAVRSFSPRERG